jgi:hypothetical protein
MQTEAKARKDIDKLLTKGIIRKSLLTSKSKDRYQFYIDNGVHLSRGILENIVSVNLFIGAKQ